MRVMSLRLPKTMYEQLKKMAETEGISMNHFVTLAIAEKMATLNTLDYLEERAKRGSRDKLLAVLAKAPDVEPEEYDKLGE
ncbi:MAG: Arc family DNA-binding protein [Anaerolineae bacterium]|nr:Arc family DNA-binding protein [Anaerolineae bacterium]